MVDDKPDRGVVSDTSATDAAQQQVKTGVAVTAPLVEDECNR